MVVFVILDNGALVNTRHIAAVLPMPPVGYPAQPSPSYLVRLDTFPASDIVITADDHRDLVDLLTGG